jgi:hypothetical protein
VQSYSFGNSGPHSKIHNPRSTPCGRKIREREERRKKERENNTVNRGHYVCHAAHLQRRTGSARTTIGPKS